MARGSDCGTSVDPEPEPAAGSDYLGTSQVAKLVGIAPRAVVKAIAEGRLPAELVGNQWRVARVEADHYTPRGRRVGAKRCHSSRQTWFAEWSARQVWAPMTAVQADLGVGVPWRGGV